MDLTECNLSGWTSSTQHDVFEIHTGSCMYQRVIPSSAEYDCMLRAYPSLFIRAPAEGRGGCFHFWAIMKRPSVHICVQVFACT